MRRRLAVVGATLALAAGGLIALAPPAAAGDTLTVTLTKTVIGTAPAGTIFTVHFQCDSGVSGDRTFNATGGAIGSSSFGDPNAGSTCTITETGTGGADNVAYSCTATSGTASCSSGNVVTHGGTAGATIRTTNAYSNALGVLTVDPTSTTPGQQVTISGTKCTKALSGGSEGTGAAVTVTINFPTPITLNTTSAGATGAWSVQVTVPADANGAYSVTAICGDPVPYPTGTVTVAGTAAAAPAPAQAVLAAPSQTG